VPPSTSCTIGRGSTRRANRFVELVLSLDQLSSPIRPASILLQPACAVAAGLVEQSLPDILPDGMRSIKSDGIRLLYFDDPSAADAFSRTLCAIGQYAGLLSRDERTWSACGPNDANDPELTLDLIS
jgi:hypothetical protein